MLNIGPLAIRTRLIMAPMSGCTDLAFRVVAAEFGCRFAFFEMLDASAALHSHKKTQAMLEVGPAEAPLGAQILGSDPDMVLKAAEVIIARSKPRLIDLNCACPAKKVIKKKAGAYLLKDPKRAGKIIKRLSGSLNLPVTIKLRSGWNTCDSQEGLYLAKTAQDNGARAVFMHGRSAKQGYQGSVDYPSIREVKKVLEIPVIGSGDIWDPESALNMFRQTGCDAILIARGALGRPWIFREIEAALEGRKVPNPPPLSQIKRVAKKHLELYKKWRNCPNKYIIGHMRKIAMWYFRGQPNATRARAAITSALSLEDIFDIIDRISK